MREVRRKPVVGDQLHLDGFLENMLRSRISRRVMAEQHINLTNPRPGYIGAPAWPGPAQGRAGAQFRGQPAPANGPRVRAARRAGALAHPAAPPPDHRHRVHAAQPGGRSRLCSHAVQAGGAGGRRRKPPRCVFRVAPIPSISPQPLVDLPTTTTRIHTYPLTHVPPIPAPLLSRPLWSTTASRPTWWPAGTPA